MLIILIGNFVYGYDIDESYLVDPYTIEDHEELIELYDNLRTLYSEACDYASSLEKDYYELQNGYEESNENYGTRSADYVRLSIDYERLERKFNNMKITIIIVIIIYLISEVIRRNK